MLAEAVETYVALRRAAGFAFKSEGSCLKSFAAFCDARGESYVRRSACLSVRGDWVLLFASHAISAPKMIVMRSRQPSLVPKSHRVQCRTSCLSIRFGN